MTFVLTLQKEEELQKLSMQLEEDLISYIKSMQTKLQTWIEMKTRERASIDKSKLAAFDEEVKLETENKIAEIEREASTIRSNILITLSEREKEVRRMNPS